MCRKLQLIHDSNARALSLYHRTKFFKTTFLESCRSVGYYCSMNESLQSKNPSSPSFLVQRPKRDFHLH